MTTKHRLLVRAEAQVHHNLFQMAKLARQALESAMDSLKTQDAELARQVVDSDLKQNNLLRIIEKECLDILGSLSPRAGDLREVVASLQIASEIERISDHAKDIAKIVLGMNPEDFSGPMDRLAAMGDLCQTMLIQVMESYENLDMDLAKCVAATDNEVDELDEEASSSLMIRASTPPTMKKIIAVTAYRIPIFL